MNTEEINGYPIPELDEMNELFPEYDVQMLVGIGSSGAIFYALKDNKAYSIKTIIGERNVRTQVEFRSEAESQRAMDHPYIVKVHDFGEIAETPYIIMDYVERGTLHEVMKEFKFDRNGIVNMAIMICQGIEYAHSKHYIHRDIVGSKGYAAPEIVKDPKGIDYRVDVYAMGAILFTMLSGEIPDAKQPDFSLLEGHDPRLKVLVKNAMNIDREKRTESVAAIRSRLERMMKSWEQSK